MRYRWHLNNSYKLQSGNSISMFSHNLDILTSDFEKISRDSLDKYSTFMELSLWSIGLILIKSITPVQRILKYETMHEFIPNFHHRQSFPQCLVASWSLPELPLINHGENIFPCCELCLSYSFALMGHGQLELQCPSLADSHPEFEFLK